MAPKSPWNKKATINANAQTNTTADAAASSSTNYGEVQSDEIELLKAMYMEDFEEVEVKGAWSKTTDRSFKLKLRSFSDDESFILLSIRLTATYPKTPPLLDVEGLQAYHERTQKRIRNVIASRPKQLLGEVMIDAIANEIRDALEDAVQAKQRGTLPSLEDERASAEEVAAALAKQAEEAEAQRQQDSKEEEDRVLKQMVSEEMNRREKRRPAKSSNDAPNDVKKVPTSEVITFDQLAALQVSGETARFSRLTVITTVSKKRDHEVLLALPQSSNNVPCPIVAVKRRTFERSRDDIMQLESALQSCQRFRHAGLLNILAYRIEKLDDLKSEVLLCTEHADRGSLHDLLQLGNLHVSQSQQFSVGILEALDYIHHQGLAHGNLTSNTVFLVGPSVSPKLADFGFLWDLETPGSVNAKWRAPEGDSKAVASLRRSDVWQFGILVSQMFLGLEITSKYSSPQSMIEALDLSDSFDDFLDKIFAVDPKKRPSAFDLLPSRFLRTDDPVMDDAPLTVPQQIRNDPRRASSSLTSPAKRRSRHNSSNVQEPKSRYANDFTEIGRLGKGGFGEVVKARNKLDGGVYAVKKIKQSSQLLDQVISEVMLLNRLNHPYVVRYFSTWIEEGTSGAVIEDSTTDTETATATAEEDTSDGPGMDFGYQSTGGLDFVSSSGYPQIEFADDDEDGLSSEGEDEDKLEAQVLQNDSPVVVSAENSDSGNLNPRKPRSESHRAPSTLYIQMEYCERHTMRDLVRKTMSSDDCWRFIRQITEGLAHIHGHGIIHRDLKPDNIFIDVAGNPKIGDFGLATTSQYSSVDKPVSMSGHSVDMTRSVGTTLYVAPELHSGSGTIYNDKADMYSLGIIFYEMCEPFSTAMERIKALQKVREKDHELPPAYQPSGQKAAQGKLISCLISHKAGERLSSTELLRSDILPLKIEDETIRQALSGLSDPRSPYHQRMMSALFSHESATNDRIKALAWDARGSGPLEDATRLRLRSIARHTLETVFKRHGAEEARRQSLFPRSGYYTNANLVQLLDASGNMLQLPYDLTLPHARQLARQSSDVRCTFAFGSVYRDAFTGGPPKVSEEVDFDIIDIGNDQERSINDAELLKAMDEVVCEMPLFAASTTVSLHLNHSSILTAVLEFCRVPVAQHEHVKEIISRLGFNEWTWSKIRTELRQFGLPDTTLDDLQNFDFRDNPEKAFARITALTDGAISRLRTKLEDAIHSLSDVVHYVQQLGIQRKMYIAPLSSVNAKFYEDGLLFQCVLERKSSRIVIAAGGRYDSLIRAHRSVEDRVSTQGCVGVSIGLDPIITNMAKNAGSKVKKKYLKRQEQEEITQKRCAVVVVASGSKAVKDAGMKMLATLWANNISAELAAIRPSNDKEHSFVLTIRHEASNTVRFSSAASEGDETDVPLAGLVSHIKQELRDHESSNNRQPSLIRQASHHDSERKSNVQVLIARHGSKKSNKFQIVNAAQDKWSDKLDSMKAAPILAVETRDEVLESIRSTRLSDLESWRKAVQGVQLNDRQYVQQIQEVLMDWRKMWSEEGGIREACLFNFRTQFCIYYDLAL